jgi:hypothetical protein
MARSNDARTVYKNSRVAANNPFGNIIFQEDVLWKLLLITALAYLIWSEKISIVFNPVTPPAAETAGLPADPETGAKRMKASLWQEVDVQHAPMPEPPKRPAPEVEVQLPAGPVSNITFAIDPGFAERNGVNSGEVEQRMQACRTYVDRYAPVAMAEMRKYGIPASVTLAQGLLESNAGDSKLARSSNNHFGIKCFSKKCRKGHCVNFTDDSHKDFFVKYANIWGSYRAHSEFLRNTSRYDRLFKLKPTDYRGWARGLVKTGYATDKKYGDKLIAMIQNLDLDQYDRQ